MNAWEEWDAPRHDVTPHEHGFWSHLGDTPAVEAARIREGEPWTITAVAGLQYYGWRQDDGLDGRHEPQPGDRLQLVREPTNPYDGNAVKVEWRNGVPLGHLARGVACDVAGALDGGTPLRAYVYDIRADDEGAQAWALRALLVGQPVAERCGRWTTCAIEHAARNVWAERRPPTHRQQEAAQAWDARRHIVRVQREADAAYAFALLDDGRPALPPGALLPPDPALAGRVFRWWDDVPPFLMTATTLTKHGLRPEGPAFAAIKYYGGGTWHRYDLHAVATARPCAQRTMAQRAAAAEAAVWRRRAHVRAA